MPLVQMTKIYASAERVLDEGKVYDLPDKLVADLMADLACIPYKHSQLPKSAKAKARLMPDQRPDPQFGNGANKPAIVPTVITNPSDEDLEDEEDSK